MRNKLLGLVFLASALGLGAKPLTFTFEEYQVEAASTEVGVAFPLARLEGMKPTFRQTVELSAEGNGKAATTLEDSTYSVDVRRIPADEFSYRLELRHDIISAVAGDIPIVTSYITNPKLKLKVGELREISGFKSGDEAKGRIWVVKLTD